MLFVLLLNVKKSEIEIYNFNKDYIQYKDTTILGSDIASLINKAVDNNEKNKVQKDEQGNYKDDSNYSIRIFVKLETEGDYFQMERIYKFNITEFVKNFSLADFKCSKILYHDTTKRVSEIYFDILE